MPPDIPSEGKSPYWSHDTCRGVDRFITTVRHPTDLESNLIGEAERRRYDYWPSMADSIRWQYPHRVGGRTVSTQTYWESIRASGTLLLDTFKSLIREGNVRRVI